MSDTDDTDDLLLIPPDFFTVDAELEPPYLTGPYYSVVDSLIEQVNKLENRINFIESTADLSLASNSLDYLAKPDLMSRVRKYSSFDDIRKINRDVGYLDSTQSTPQKPKTRFRLSSIGSSPSLSPHKVKPHYTSAYSKHHKSPTKLNGYINDNATNSSTDQHKEEMLQEIDKFICNMQGHKSEETTKFTSEPKFGCNERLSLNDLNHMLEQIESQETDFNYECGRLADNNYEKFAKERTWQSGDNKTSVPDRGYGMRHVMYNEANEFNKNFRSGPADPILDQGPSTSDLSTIYTESLADKSDSVSSSSESTQVTTLPNVNRLMAGGGPNTTTASEVPNAQNYRKHNTNDKINDQRNELRHARRNIMENDAVKKTQAFNDNSHRLLSLSHLWNRRERNQEYIIHEVNVMQKFEEEKLRRQHCEQLIQQLQLRTLELQERMAVALQVDEAKDDAILRFHKAWEQVAIRLKSLSRERDELEKQINDMNIANTNNVAEATKKIAHFENEASMALTLAHSNQEKLSTLEKRHGDLANENEDLLKKIATASSDNEIVTGKAKQLSDIISQKETELNENKNALVDARNEISQSKRAIEMCQAELTTMKTQYTHLEIVLSEKQDVIRNLELQNRKLAGEIDSHRKIEKDLQQELYKSKETNEKNKVELRNFYQDQVEIVVRDKLKEFQSQLDKAEMSLLDELKKRELTIAKSAAVHIQQITEKHSLEVRLLEEKHREEIRLHQVQLSQAQQHLENLNHKFQQQQQKRSDMVQQLHKVMEAQWFEALKIINNGRSPIVSQDQDVTINQLNILKSKSHSNLEEVLSMDVKGNAPDMRLHKKAVDVPPLNFGASTSSINGDVRSWAFLNQSETPLSSRPQSKQQIENELQKYVQMLLNKSPGNPTQEPIRRELYSNDEEHQMLPTVQDDNKMRTVSSKDKKLKPPWK